MQGNKLALVKQALRYVLTQLSPQDRLSVISFNDSVTSVWSLRACTDEQKATMAQIMAEHPQMQADGGTNIKAGLWKGLEQVAERRLKTAVPAVFLLTDGQGGAPCEGMLAAKLQEMPEHCPIHCFGFGRDHDAHTLNMIAQTGHGTFAFVEDENKVSDAFATL
eukprot:g3918.t1